MKNFIKKHLALIGVIIILACSSLDVIVAQKHINDKDTNNDYIYNIITITTKAASAIGVSLVVGYLTTKFQKEDFVKEEYIKDVQEIYNTQISPLIEDSLSVFITNPDTMKMLDTESREELIKNATISNNGLDTYKDKVIHEVMGFTEYRHDGYLIVNAYINDGNVYIDMTISYVKCSINDTLREEGTYVDDDKTSELLYIKYIDPNDSGKYVVVSHSEENNQLTLKSSPAFGSTCEYFNLCEIPEIFKEYNEIKIEKKIRFKGSNHWINVGWMHSCPTKGFNLSITCRDGLEIKESIVIDASNTYNVPSNGDDDKFYLSTSQWVSANTGFVITIGKNDTNNPKDDS